MKNIIIYDFDGTLTPYPMPKLEILEKNGMKDGSYNPLFLELSRKKARDKNMNLYQAMFETYCEIILSNGDKLIDENFSLGHDKVEYNNGVLEFFEMLNKNNIKNYLVSSGIKVFLQKTSVASYFEEIYATTFKYNKMHEAIGIDFLMSDENKVYAIKQILQKNNIFTEDCSKVIYIGDGLSDYYAMKYVKEHGGICILVFLSSNAKEIASMKEKNIVSLFTKADFSIDSELTQYVNKLCRIK